MVDFAQVKEFYDSGKVDVHALKKFADAASKITNYTLTIDLETNNAYANDDTRAGEEFFQKKRDHQRIVSNFIGAFEKFGVQPIEVASLLGTDITAELRILTYEFGGRKIRCFWKDKPNESIPVDDYVRNPKLLNCEGCVDMLEQEFFPNVKAYGEVYILALMYGELLDRYAEFKAILADDSYWKNKNNFEETNEARYQMAFDLENLASRKYAASRKIITNISNALMAVCMYPDKNLVIDMVDSIDRLPMTALMSLKYKMFQHMDKALAYISTYEISDSLLFRKAVKEADKNMLSMQKEYSLFSSLCSHMNIAKNAEEIQDFTDEYEKCCDSIKNIKEELQERESIGQ